MDDDTSAVRGIQHSRTPGFSVVVVALALLVTMAVANRVHRPVVRGDSGPATHIGLRIDINSASAAELQLLPLIGPALGERIVEDRAVNGPFKSLDELRRVPGIGSVTIERISPHAVVQP